MTDFASGQGSSIRAVLVSFGLTVLVGCASQQTSPITASSGETAPGNVDSLLIVDCLLPGQIRKLGRNFTYLTPRRATKSAASECEIRGGEYTSYDRANFATALKIWLPQAKSGDAEAQTYVGEIYEKGLGLESDYSLAAFWYGKAADQGFSRAQINLGFLHESGLGVPQDLTRAMNLYRDASGFREGELEFVSSVEAANRVVRKQERVDLEDQVAILEVANADLRQKQGEIDRERSEVARISREVKEQRGLILEAQAALDADEAARAADGQASEAAVAAAEARANSDTARLGRSLAELEQAGKALEAAQVREQALRVELDAQKTETTQLQQRVNADNAELRGKSKDLSTSEQQIAQLSARINELEQGNQAEQSSNAELSANREALEKRLFQERASAEQLRQEVTRLQSSQSDTTRELQRQLADARLAKSDELSASEQQIAQLNVRINELQQDNQAEQSSTAALSANREALETRLFEEQASAEQLRQEVARLQSSQGDTARELQRQLAEARQAKSEDLSASEQQIAQLNVRINELEQGNQAEQSSNASLSADREALEKRLSEERASAEQLRQEVAQLQSSQSDASVQLQLRLEQARLTETGLNSRLNDELAQLRDLKTQQADNEAKYASDLAKLRGQLASAQDEQRTLGEQALDQQERLETAQAEQRRLSERVMLGEIDAEQQSIDASRRLAALEQQLSQKQGIIVKQQSDIESLQNNVTQVRASLEDRDIEKVNQVVALGPTIEIIEPPVLVSRGKPSLKSLPGSAEMEIIGRIGPLDNLLTFKINGKTLQLNDNGVFVHKVRPADVSTLQMVAVSDAGERTDLEFNVLGTALSKGAAVPSEAGINPDNIEFGDYYALIIGNNQYEGFHDLKSAEADALAMEKMFRERYGFKTELLLNATRYEILSAMNRKREQLSDKDNLVVYYAGHGELSNGKGYWMPVDAEPNSTTNWISNTAITDMVESMSAKHVMVIADSCYSGSLTRSSLARIVPGMTPETKLKWYNSVAALKVRTVLSSGGVKPVLDSNGTSKHSLFAQALLDELGSADGIVEAYELFLKVQKRVKQGARQFNLDQNPQYSPIKHAGHESGEFLFVSKQGSSARAPAKSEPLSAVMPVGGDSSS